MAPPPAVPVVQAQATPVFDPLAEPTLAPMSADFASTLPTFDDFRQRDASAAAEAAAPSASTQGAALTPQEQVQERIMELMSFDTIDERPADEEPYSYTDRVLGRGLPNKTGAYFLPYVQSGHMLLLGVLLLASLISYPGFPLTELPEAYQSLVLQGIGLTFVINAGTAVYSRGLAEAKEEPVVFWFVKCLLFGGLALGELTNAVPTPMKPKNGRGAGR